MPLVTQANYARRRGISREAVRQRTVPAGGPILVHGPRTLLDVDQADALETTKSTAGAFHTKRHRHPRGAVRARQSTGAGARCGLGRRRANEAAATASRAQQGTTHRWETADLGSWRTGASGERQPKRQND
jgi:hypothetical protein